MIQKIRTFGFVTKGLVYAIIGILTFLTALNIGGKVSDRNTVIAFLENQIFGKVLLLIVGTGMLSYAIWRFYKSFLVVTNKNKKTKYILMIDFFMRGIIYGSFAISILYKAVNQSTQGVSKESLVTKILNLENGAYILYTIAIIIFISAINQFYIVTKNKHLKNIEQSKNLESFAFLKKTGTFGISARGISFLIFAWFIFKAASEQNPNQIKGTQEMFTYLHNLTFGDILMAIMALGFISYGIFQYFYARYSSY
ncbi:DUF1206 domain-containing protein [Polaribacter aestuariivivens]|uniref:DUF1206 domain-containing protein n=1 Tax=Polaribacter aestuariivivens TaxID=2304626 RepID=A0A5S3N1B3_9FLAO|nr:DUF1206 domain-containing protein [Polaribacter aestuariivivens]TMM29015.1 DUF1206 domain-containing protein [Polaribacter aestuariivivens]